MITLIQIINVDYTCENYVSFFEHIFMMGPQYIDALNNKGFALANIGNYTEAILYYDKDLAIQPNLSVLP